MRESFNKTGMTKCISCQQLKYRERSELFPGTKKRWVYRDADGKRWYAKKCNSCKKIEKESPRSLSKDPNCKKGYESERSVKLFFEKIGFAVLQTKAHGHDLIICSGNSKRTCEVKSVLTRRKSHYYTAHLSKNNRLSDYIALVFPNGNIQIEPMGMHLSKCSIGGYRRL